MISPTWWSQWEQSRIFSPEDLIKIFEFLEVVEPSFEPDKIICLYELEVEATPCADTPGHLQYTRSMFTGAKHFYFGKGYSQFLLACLAPSSVAHL